MRALEYSRRCFGRVLYLSDGGDDYYDDVTMVASLRGSGVTFRGICHLHGMAFDAIVCNVQTLRPEVFFKHLVPLLQMAGIPRLTVYCGVAPQWVRENPYRVVE